MRYNTRQAILALLAATEGSSGKLGKKAAQKYVHILSSIFQKNFGYDFSFYTYGAFSRDLAQDLDVLDAFGILDIKYNSGDNSYSISATERSEALSKELPETLRSSVVKLWKKFSGKSAYTLELYSTILFVRDSEKLEISSDKMADRVQNLKPKYSRSEIKHAQHEMDLLTKQYMN